MIKQPIPNQLQSLKDRLAKMKIPARLLFIILGIASTVWFLLRVIPKPQRATYPCMRVAAPVMSSFIIYLLSLSGIVLAFRQSKKKFFQAKYLAAAGFLMVSVISAVIYFAHDTNPVKAATLPDAPNTPMGVAQGIMPGRVAWAHCEEAICQGMENTVPMLTKYNQDSKKYDNIGSPYDTMTNRVYYNPRFVYQPAIDSMVKGSVLALANETNLAVAWDTIFRYFNKKKKGTPTGYKSGEKIFIKINLTGGSSLVAYNTTWGRLFPNLVRYNPGWQAHPDIVETNPFTVLSILRELVYVAGVPDSLIYIGDPMKNVYQDFYEYWKKEFPKVNVLANKYLAASMENPASIGRVAVVKGTVDRIFYSSGGLTDKFYTVTENADYLINMAVLKAHNRNGITLCAKNHFGSQTRDNANHLHGSLIAPLETTQTNATYGKYRILVDMMGNKYLGGNTLLFIVDGLVSAEKDWDGPAIKFKMAPFNNSYPASIFMSLDQVALESVCFDFLRTEFDTSLHYGHKSNSPYIYGAVDDYLHQAADTNNWPVGIKYKPNGDGKTIASLGAHEHWNNATDKQYSRNLDAINGKGIELFKISFSMPHAWDTATPVPNKLKQSSIEQIRIYPNPATTNVIISFEVTANSSVSVDIFNMNGQKIVTLVNQRIAEGEYTANWNLENVAEGLYICKMSVTGDNGTTRESKKIQVIK
jgi:hypothetical protein